MTAEPERQNGDDGERVQWTPAEVTQCKANVGDERFDPSRATGIARFLMQHADVPELATRFEPRRFRRHAARDQAIDGALEMCVHLLAHLPIERVSPKDRPQSSEHRAPCTRQTSGGPMWDS